MWFSTQDLLGKLSKLWLYFVILLMAQEVHAWVIIDPTCANFGNVLAASREAVYMARNAATRQIGLRDASLNLADWLVTLRTFNAYFGTLARRQPNLPNPYVAPNAAQISATLVGKSSPNNLLYG